MSSDEVPMRQLGDPRALRAVSHPVRIALMEALADRGPLTATEAGTLLGESPANCSFHLRVLAKYGFVEEAEGGRGRQRPWRIVPTINQIHGAELDAEATVASQALTEVMRQRELQQLRTWESTRSEYPPEWQHAGGETHALLYLTAEELSELESQFVALIARGTERIDPALRPPDALPVSALIRTFPTRPPTQPTPPVPPPAVPDEPQPPGTPDPT